MLACLVSGKFQYKCVNSNKKNEEIYLRCVAIFCRLEIPKMHEIQSLANRKEHSCCGLKWVHVTFLMCFYGPSYISRSILFNVVEWVLSRFREFYFYLIWICSVVVVVVLWKYCFYSCNTVKSMNSNELNMQSCHVIYTTKTRLNIFFLLFVV